MNQPEQSQLERSLDLLGPDPNHGWDDIEKHYRKLVQQWHPDRHAGEQRDNAESKFIEINQAYKHIRSHYLKTGSIPRRNPAVSPAQSSARKQPGPLLGTKKETLNKPALYKNKLLITGTITLMIGILFGVLLWSLDSRLAENNRGRATAEKLESVQELNSTSKEPGLISQEPLQQSTAEQEL